MKRYICIVKVECGRRKPHLDAKGIKSVPTYFGRGTVTFANYADTMNKGAKRDRNRLQKQNGRRQKQNGRRPTTVTITKTKASYK